jgi:6-phosphogluconolactonase
MSPLPGEVLTQGGAAEVAVAAAERIGEALQRAIGSGRRASLALSGGNTPRGAYEHLAHQSGIDWAQVDVLWVDERSVAPTDDRSNYRWAKETLLDVVLVAGGRAARMEAERPDLEEAAREYERVLRARVLPDEHGIPSFDVMVLGIGDDGHTASLFPGEPTVEVTDRLVAAVSPHPPAREARLTLTVPVIEHARQVVVLVVGANKRDALARVADAHGDVHKTPARIIRSCLGTLLWIGDKAALGP